MSHKQNTSDHKNYMNQKRNFGATFRRTISRTIISGTVTTIRRSKSADTAIFKASKICRKHLKSRDMIDSIFCRHRFSLIHGFNYTLVARLCKNFKQNKPWW